VICITVAIKVVVVVVARVRVYDNDYGFVILRENRENLDNKNNVVTAPYPCPL